MDTHRNKSDLGHMKTTTWRPTTCQCAIQWSNQWFRHSWSFTRTYDNFHECSASWWLIMAENNVTKTWSYKSVAIRPLDSNCLQFFSIKGANVGHEDLLRICFPRLLALVMRCYRCYRSPHWNISWFECQVAFVLILRFSFPFASANLRNLQKFPLKMQSPTH